MKIYKYELTPDTPIRIPHSARVLSVQVVDNTPWVWAMVCPENSLVDRMLAVFPTGSELPDHIVLKPFVGTFQLNDGGLLFVFHVFDLGETYR